MCDKSALLHLISRAERGALLPEEAQILRDAVNLMESMGAELKRIAYTNYRPACDDEAPGRP